MIRGIDHRRRLMMMAATALACFVSFWRNRLGWSNKTGWKNK